MRENDSIQKRRVRAGGLLILAHCFFCVLFSLESAEAVENFKLRVAVAEGVTSGRLLGQGLTLRDSRGVDSKPSDGAQVVASRSGVSVGGRDFSLPVGISASGGLGWDKNRYRGTLSIVKAKSGFTVVNEVDLESYLRGILKIEMNPEWPSEALKAQAILARTYAAGNRGRFAAWGYDLCATVKSQVYRGVNAEDPRTDAAVSATRGMILTWGNRPADVYYHSDSGGATADVAQVWGGSRHYLRVQREIVDYVSPYSSWKTTLNVSQVTAAAAKMGLSVGTVESVEVSLKDDAGRAVWLRLRGSKGVADVKAHAFRMAVGSNVLRSTNFRMAENAVASLSPPAVLQTPVVSFVAPVAVDASISNDPLVEMTQKGVFSKAEMLDMLMNPSKREEYIEIGRTRMPDVASPPPARRERPLPKPATNPPVVAAGSFTFLGKGWGHGVGLSQWGAKAMAERGMRFEEILAHYFPGTKIAE